MLTPNDSLVKILMKDSGEKPIINRSIEGSPLVLKPQLVQNEDDMVQLNDDSNLMIEEDVQSETNHRFSGVRKNVASANFMQLKLPQSETDKFILQDLIIEDSPSLTSNFLNVKMRRSSIPNNLDLIDVAVLDQLNFQQRPGSRMEVRNRGQVFGPDQNAIVEVEEDSVD